MTELSKDVVEVTRADRKVAAALARGGFPGFQGNKIIATEIMGKLHDGYFLVQEIARHRLTSAATLQSQCDRYRELEAAAKRLLTVFDQQKMTAAERIIIGISDAGLRIEGNAAIDDLRAAFGKATSA